MRAGRVAAVSAEPLPQAGCRRVLDAGGCWVLPGFLDVHTHYDIEVLLSPGLPESVRHGVTTVVLGNCSLSAVYCAADDVADLFSRVEALPHAAVLDALKRHRSWSGADEYVRALLARPLGPNVAAFLGHSDLRAYVMGLGRAVGADPASGRDLDRMTALLGRALDAGFLGLSTVTSTHCRLDGERFRSARLPSTFAGWREYRALHRVLRARGRVLQSAPTRPGRGTACCSSWPAPGWGAASAEDVAAAGARLRRLARGGAPDHAGQPAAGGRGAPAAPADPVRAVRRRHRSGHLRGVRRHGGRAAPAAGGRAGAAAVEAGVPAVVPPRLRQPVPAPVRRRHPGLPRRGVVGRSFGEVAHARGRHPAETFLDLVVAYGSRLRWRTTVAGGRPHVLDRLAGDPAVLLGFAESGRTCATWPATTSRCGCCSAWWPRRRTAVRS
ncbi:amidohydrolase family protein [Nonomuraea thailandensis]